MRLISKIAFALAIVFSATSFSSAAEKPTKSVITLEQQVLKRLGTPEILSGAEEAITLNFLINNQNKIVVMDVAGGSKKLKSYVLKKLQFQKIKDANYAINEVYSLPIRFLNRE